MFVYSMATRRNRRTRQTRKGSGWFSQKARNAGLDPFDWLGSSTSLLAREIYAMLDDHGIKRSRQADFDDLMSYHLHVKKGKLLRDLRKLGMTDLQEYDVVANIEFILSPGVEKYETTTV
jgi:hypothetical protein